MTRPIHQGDILWRPTKETTAHANLTRFSGWLKREHRISLPTYEALWKWSTDDINGFWGLLWKYFDIQSSGAFTAALSLDAMPGAHWFEGSRINYTEHVFRNMTDSRPALIFKSEEAPAREISWQMLYRQVAGVAKSLREMGIKEGDRVAAVVPNIPEALVAFLATASIGAVWSSCSPDFAARSITDRFGQIKPRILFAVNAYVYGGKTFDIRDAVRRIKDAIPELEQVVMISCPDTSATVEPLPGTLSWDSLATCDARFEPTRVPFDHPLWIVYSSGTTGIPKGLVHSQGGAMLELMKYLTFHIDLHTDDVFFWFSTTGWVMWNILQAGLLVGAVPVLYDGHPGYPDMKTLWRMAQDVGVTYFGTSAAFITACMREGFTPGKEFDLHRIRGVGSTGSPLSPEGFRWVYDAVGEDLILGSTSGGTDVASGFLGACPLSPVKAGELQCRCLGVRVEAWDDEGNALTDEVGELVITRPMPSMPVFLWNDTNGTRYENSYFNRYPGVWCHGDWLRLTPEGGAEIMGRSDATLKRQGVRMGSSDFYRVVEEMPEIQDSLIVGYRKADGTYRMPLFVVLKDGIVLSPELRDTINRTLRHDLSPRHVPDDIIAVTDIPKTLNGKKLEVPVIRILEGSDIATSVNPDSMQNPESLDFFIAMAEKT